MLVLAGLYAPVPVAWTVWFSELWPVPALVGYCAGVTYEVLTAVAVEFLKTPELWVGTAGASGRDEIVTSRSTLESAGLAWL